MGIQNWKSVKTEEQIGLIINVERLLSKRLRKFGGSDCILVLCSKYWYDDVSSQRFDDTSIDTAGPVSILWHVCTSGPPLIWIQEHRLKWSRKVCGF